VVFNFVLSARSTNVDLPLIHILLIRLAKQKQEAAERAIWRSDEATIVF